MEPKIETAENILLDPIVNLASVKELRIVCNDRLFSWLSNNAPKDVIKLAINGSALDYFLESAKDNGGKLSEEDNKTLQDATIAALNALGALGWW